MGFRGGPSRNGSILILALALAGCSGSGGDAGNRDDNAVAVANTVIDLPSDGSSAMVAANAADGATVGGDGSQISLTGLSPGDLGGAHLAGELACSFTAADGAMLLFAKGDVKSKTAAQGVVKVSTYVEDVAAPGGFDGMLKGAGFSGKGKTVRIVTSGPALGGGESPPYAATLTYDRADGAQRVFPGQWTCGP